MLRLAGVVLWDIVVSNLTVARLTLDPRAEAAAGLGGFPAGGRRTRPR